MLEREVYGLTSENIDAVSEKIEAFLTEEKCEKETVLRNRLLAEEILLRWRNQGISESFTLSYGRHFRKPVVELSCFGLPCALSESSDEESSVIMNQLLQSLGQQPDYSYKDGKNIVALSLPRKEDGSLRKILTAMLCGIGLGLGCNAFLPETLCTGILEEIVEPLYSAGFRLLNFISGPLILLSVLWGIYGIGDAGTFGRVGKRIIVRFLLLLLAVTLVATLNFPVFGCRIESSGGSVSAFGSIFAMLLDIIPSNIIEPITSGNTLQLIFSAVVIGIALLYLGRQVDNVVNLLDEINHIVQYCMGVVGRLMPCIIFLIILRVILSHSLAAFASVWLLMLIFLGTSLLLCGLFTVYTALRFHVSPLILMRKSLPTFLIAITTASSSAAFSTNYETCTKKFGIDGKLCAFGIPLGMVMFKTGNTLHYLFVSFFFARVYGITVSGAWIVSAAIIAAMLSIATPPAAGGTAAAFTMLFAKLGIPMDALAIVLSMDIIFDFVRTAVNLYNLALVLIHMAASTDMLDKDALRKKE